MSAIDQARAHFGRLETAVIEVPEWADDSGKPLLIYHSPITLAEKARLHGISEQVGDIEMLAHVLIMKAKDAEGKALFTVEDKAHLLHRVDSNVLARVARALTVAATVKEQEKN